ncbi:serine hydrolase domain-containing protein [Phenylobacterium sp.]|uniref:serine hydrolase domain-containing protein n=1 Tax=Phenylobacterium sp. TaxID=1871053 RepID=UPI00374DB665
MFGRWAGLLLLLLAGPAVAAPTPAFQAAVDAAALRGFAGEIGLSDRTATLDHRAVSAPGHPHATGEVWRWASVTKQITATLAMQEVAAGHLSLDDTVAARLPAFGGATGGQITLRMLLQHTSGLPNPDDTGAADDKQMPAFYRRPRLGSGRASDALGYCAGKPKAPPGAGFAYNNCDFIVLGAILERSSGKPFAALVQGRIAGPLGLRSLKVATGTGEPATVRGRLDAATPEPAFHLATFGASGAVYGTAADLLAFDRGLLSGRLLDAKATATAWAGDPRLGYVALGVWAFPATLRGCAGEVRLVERRGEIGGVEVRNILAPDLGRALVVFADRSDLDFGEIWQGKGLSFDLASAAFCA